MMDRNGQNGWTDIMEREIVRLQARLADAEREARVLVVAMADQFGAPDNWKPLPDAAGMITQISNMVAGLREERALLVARAENAEAALVEAERRCVEQTVELVNLAEGRRVRLAEAERLLREAADYLRPGEPHDAAYKDFSRRFAAFLRATDSGTGSKK